MLMQNGVLIPLFTVSLLFGQDAAYDFYPEFRNWVTYGSGLSLGRYLSREPQAVSDAIRKYAAKLTTDGIPDAEISRREQLLRTAHTQLENEFWNRFFTEGKEDFNTAPNAFLAEVIKTRRAGTALDYGMGEGRNAIFLAQRGWTVSGFDPADRAVAVAAKRAADLGLKVDFVVAPDTTYDFGQQRFDLVLFSWTFPGFPSGAGSNEIVQKVVRSLTSEGIVVMECGADFGGANGMLKMFQDALQIIEYKIETEKSDFFGRKNMPILKMIARRFAEH